MSEKLVIEEVHLHITPHVYPRPDILRVEVEMTVNGKRFVSTRLQYRNDFESYFDFYWDIMKQEIKERVSKEFRFDDK